MRLFAAVVAGAALAAAAVDGCLAPVKNAGGDTAEAAADRAFLTEAVVGNWWPVSASAARRVIARYGVPDEVRSGHLVWNGAGPWSRVVVRDVTPLLGPVEDVGVVEQAVVYRLTPAQAAELKKYDRRVGYERVRRELRARSDREEINFLRLNLADDVVKSRMTPEQARLVHARVLRLENAGKSSPYLEGLRFSPEERP